jgi:GNAT superfamily N-acetyltransferase
MQATTCFHNGVPNPVLQEADFVFHDSIAFHPANGMFDADADGRDPTIGRFFRGREVPSTRCFLGLEDRDPILEESLEALLLIQTAARWQGIARQLRQALIRRFAFTSVAQEANVTRLSDHEEVFERVALLLATVILLLLFGICRAVDRTFGAIMPKRGVVDLPSVACVSNIAANSAAVRAGSSS